jgi:multiple sugar transport system permease protein
VSAVAPVARSPAEVAARRERRAAARRRAAWRRRRLVLLLMAPWILGFGIFFGYPLISSAYLSFTHYDLLSSPRWVGLANYRFLFTKDAQIGPAVRNTLWLIAIAVPLQLVFAFGVAHMLTRARRGIGVWRTIFYLPALAPPVAATIGFVYLLNPATGPVNVLLDKVGIQGPLWFDSPAWSKPSLTLLGMWGIGNTMLIFLAALVDVPRHLHESAELDGAGWWARLRWVTLPSIRRCSTSTRPTSRRASRRAARARRPTARGATSARPRARRSSIPSFCTSRASASSTWATRRRWRCSCSSSRLR